MPQTLATQTPESQESTAEMNPCVEAVCRQAAVINPAAMQDVVSDPTSADYIQPQYSPQAEANPWIRHLKATEHGKDDARASVMIIVLVASAFTSAFTQSMMNIALPRVAHDFSTSLTIANWIVVGYNIMAAITITVAPAILKRWGLKKTFTVACGAITVGSVIGLLAANFPFIVASRLIQAFGSGLILPSATAAIAIIAPKERIGRLLALNSAMIGIGEGLGPFFSGWILAYSRVGLMYLPPLILGGVLIIGGLIFLHNVEERGHRPIDALSLVFSAVGLTAFMFGLGEITHDVVPAIIGLIVGAIFMVLFSRRQRHLSTPLLNLEPMRHPGFSVGILLVLLGTMAAASMSLLLPLFYEGFAGADAFLAGAFIAGPLVLYGILSILAGRIFDKKGIFPMVPGGFILILVGFVTIMIAANAEAIAWVVGLSCLVYGGNGFVEAPAKSKALSQLSKDLYSHGAAINSTIKQVADSIGAALFVGVLSADVLQMTGEGIKSTDAYAHGFAQTLVISIVLAVISLVIAFIYSWKMRNRVKPGP